MDILDVFTPQAIAAYWTEVQSNYVDYMGPGLFPAQQKAGLELSWFKGHNQEPISLMPSAFDANVTFRDRIGFERVELNMPFFREAKHVYENDRQKIMGIQNSDNPFAREIINRAFDDVADLLSGALVVPERMIMQLLFAEDGNVGISIVANGVDYTYNYDPNGEWKKSNYIALTGADLWTATSTADPFKAIKTAKDAIRKRSNAQITTAIMNSATFEMLSSLDAVKNRWLTVNGKTLGYLTDPEVKDVIRGTLGIDIALYDKGYRDENKVSRQFVPDGYVALVPNGTLGTTWYGTTPEQADLMNGRTNANVAVVNTGIAITQVQNVHPASIDTWASEIVLPSYERMDEVALLKVVA